MVQGGEPQQGQGLDVLLSMLQTHAQEERLEELLNSDEALDGVEDETQ